MQFFKLCAVKNALTTLQLATVHRLQITFPASVLCEASLLLMKKSKSICVIKVQNNKPVHHATVILQIHSCGQAGGSAEMIDLLREVPAEHKKKKKYSLSLNDRFWMPSLQLGLRGFTTMFSSPYAI